MSYSVSGAMTSSSGNSCISPPSLKIEDKTKALSFFIFFFNKGIICCKREEGHLFREQLFQRKSKEVSEVPSDLEITFLSWSLSQLASPRLV